MKEQKLPGTEGVRVGEGVKEGVELVVEVRVGVTLGVSAGLKELVGEEVEVEVPVGVRVGDGPKNVAFTTILEQSRALLPGSHSTMVQQGSCAQGASTPTTLKVVSCRKFS